MPRVHNSGSTWSRKQKTLHGVENTEGPTSGDDKAKGRGRRRGGVPGMADYEQQPAQVSTLGRTNQFLCWKQPSSSQEQTTNANVQ